jgi:hypothetical protein
MKIVYRFMLFAGLFASSVTLMGCGGGGGGTVYVEDPRPINYTPELRSFNLFDSYDIDTRVDATTPLTLSPYLYDGLFDVFWGVNSLEDYHVELRINDIPDPQASFLIHRELCGAGLWCDQAGNLICEYTSDLYMACEGEPLVDISLLFPQIPEELYLILQVCDINSSYCEFDYYPVLME